MKYSILTLLAATAYVAMTLAGLAQPSSYWPEAAFYFTVVVLVYLVAVACGPTAKFSVFARGFVIGFALFLSLRTVEPSYLDSDRLQLLNWYWWFRETHRVLDGMDALAELVNQTVFGLVCGILALWRYRRNEKAHREAGEP